MYSVDLRIQSEYGKVRTKKTLSSITFLGIRTIAAEENCPRLGLGFGLGLALELGLGGNFPRGQLFWNHFSHSETFTVLTKFL